MNKEVLLTWNINFKMIPFTRMIDNVGQYRFGTMSYIPHSGINAAIEYFSELHVYI
jgi:hypothetical protein